MLKIKLAVAALALCSAPAFADPTACVVAGAAEGGGGNRPFAAARDQPDREYATFEKATHRGVTFYLRAGHGVIRLEAWQGKKRLASTFSSSGRNPPAADSLTLEVAGPTGSVEAQCSGIAAATTSVPAR